MSPALASGNVAATALSGLLREDETVLLMIRPSAWFIVSTSMRALPAAAAAGAALMIATIDPSIPWDFRGALLASAAIILARAAWQTVDWLVRLYVLTDRRIVVRRGVIPEVFECLLGEVVGVGQPHRWVERIGGTGSLAILRGPSRRVRKASRFKQSFSIENVAAPAKAAERHGTHPRVLVAHELEWSVIADSQTVRRTILHAVTRYR